MRTRIARAVLLCVVMTVVSVLSPAMTAQAPVGAHLKLVFCCAAYNDLYRVMTADRTRFPRYGSAKKAIEAAPEGAGVLILADGYPQGTTTVDAAVFDQAAKKKLRLYVEYPTSLPDMNVDKPRHTQLERVVVMSDVFGGSLKQMGLL